MNDDIKKFDKAARAFLRNTGTTVFAGRGRTDNVGYAHNAVPVEVVAGDSEPRLLGLPYWKTCFRNGAFSKTLYTPSTLRVVVGADWNPYNDDNH